MADPKDKSADLGPKWNTTIDYMLPHERTYLKQLRDGGILSVFRTTICAFKGCENEVIKGKVFCSKEHKLAFEAAAQSPIEKAAKDIAKNIGRFVDALKGKKPK